MYKTWWHNSVAIITQQLLIQNLDFLQVTITVVVYKVYRGRHSFTEWSQKDFLCVRGCTCVCVPVCSITSVVIFAAPWTVAHQASLSIGFSRQEYWSGLPHSPPRYLLGFGIDLYLQHILHWQADIFTLSATWEAYVCV